MATLSTASLTIVDIAKRTDPSGKAATIAEILQQTNAILDDIPWYPSNQPTSHRTTSRTSLPTPTWRTYNAGIASTKSTTAQSDEQMGMLEDLSEVDIAVANLGGNLNENRMNEARAHIEGMGQEMTRVLFLGNAGTHPEQFTGFSPRFNSTTGVTGQNVLSGGGSGSDNSSIWLIGWGRNKVYGLYPMGSSAGLEHKNLGEVLSTVTAGVGGNRMLVYADHFRWYAGLAVEDWRYAVRGANIDISNLVAKSSAADLFDLMIKMSHHIPNLQGCTPVYYVNRTVFQMLDIQGRDDVQTGGQLSYGEVAGRRLPFFRGIPVRLVDQLTETESAVS